MRLVKLAVLILLLAGLALSGRTAWAGGLEDWSAANREAGLGRLEEALALFDRALEEGALSPADQAKVHASRGVVKRKKGDLDGALNDFRKALALDPELKEAYLNRGNLWRIEGRPYKALADYSKALELDPGWAEPYHGIAWLLATNRDPNFRNAATALEMAGKAVSLERNANHLDTLAAAQARNGKFDEAVKTQEEALSLLTGEGRTDREEAFKRRLESYRNGKPWEE